MSRFSDETVKNLLDSYEIERIEADLLDPAQIATLPDAENVIFMAGKKFGTTGQEYLTWAMNTMVPGLVANRYRNSSILVFSSGNLYPMMPFYSGGADETVAPSPIGEYAQSCLGRERIFEYFSNTFGTKCLFYRLNYAVALRYGVLYDLAGKIWEGKPVALDTAGFNCIWQRDANEIALRGLLHAENPPAVFNVTGPETVSTRGAAEKLGKYLGKEPVFCGQEQPLALLDNAGKAMSMFGYPKISLNTMIQWQAEWILNGGSSLGKPTHFAEREGKF